jgi:hypothetical protein
MRFLCSLLVFFAIIATANGANPPDGTVVIWENGNYLGVVQRQTGSNKTHAGIVLYEGNQPYVYEASRPDVHRYPIQTYYDRITAAQKQFPKLRIHWIEPKTPYSPAQFHAMKTYANVQLGRPFGVQSYMLGRPLKTMHCCEYVGNILASSGRYSSLGPRETPKTLYERTPQL